MRKFSLVVATSAIGLLALGSVAGASFPCPYVFPSTNDLNKANDHGYVEVVASGPGYVTLRFVNAYVGLQYFEYRIDGQVLTPPCQINHLVLCNECEYPGVCVGGGCGGPRTMTFTANQKVEVRLALGGERDWDFDWTTFDVEPPVPPEHFQCYEVDKPKSERLGAKPKVDLEDQFGLAKGVTVEDRPDFLCAPVDKNGEGVVNRLDYLACYKIKGVNANQAVPIKNQFGEQILKLKDGKLLCVPSTKSEP